MSKASRKRAKAKWQLRRRDKNAEYTVNFGRVAGSQPMFGAGVTPRAAFKEPQEVPMMEHKRKAKPDHRTLHSIRMVEGKARKLLKVRSLRTIPELDGQNLSVWLEHWKAGALPKPKRREEVTLPDLPEQKSIEIERKRESRRDFLKRIVRE